MKIRYIFTSLIAALALVLTGCSDQEMVTLDNVQVNKSYVGLPATGGSAAIQVTANDSWTITDVPEWLSLSATSGSAGESTVTFTAAATTKTQTCTVFLTCGGQTQRINVIQQTEKVELPISSCADVIKGADSDSYRVKGTVTKIVNTTYGNWYINDGTGEVYIYGTLDASGAEKNFSSLGIEAGDIVTCEGPKTTYGGVVELVNVSVVKIEKSLIKLDSLSVASLPKEGGEVIAYLTCKGEGVSVEAPVDWISVKSIKTSGTSAEVALKVTANEGGARSTELSFVTTSNGKTYSSTTEFNQEGAIQDVNCAEFNAKADGTALYKVRGIITSIANSKYGNLYINDGTGEVYVYGITGWNADDYKVGDEVVLQSVKTSYKDAPQMKNAEVIEKVSHDVKTVAELQAAADDKNTFYLVTGTVFHLEGDAYKYDLTTYGNFGLKDETGEIYVYGVADALGGKTKNFAATGIKEGDNITILAYKTSYKGNNQIVGQFIKINEAQ